MSEHDVAVAVAQVMDIYRHQAETSGVGRMHIEAHVTQLVAWLFSTATVNTYAFVRDSGGAWKA